ncbi:MAG: hypothetical protein CMM37_02305 [Rhodospirillaceae bacterium]|nr:hypothetical protein [Rhodospirillaceae bacterium]
MGRLSGKVAIVTGGARSIGAAFAKGLAAEGARIVIADLEPADEVLGIIEQAGVRRLQLIQMLQKRMIVSQRLQRP